ncbi:MAG: hypothetical protein WDO24_22335 [Pseudomonadota bacterium]
MSIFTGSAPQVPAALNSTKSYTNSCSYLSGALRDGPRHPEQCRVLSLHHGDGARALDRQSEPTRAGRRAGR